MRNLKFFFLLIAIIENANVMGQNNTITATISYNNVFGGGHYSIYRNETIDNITIPNLRKAFIFVEPWDPNNARDIPTLYSLLNQNSLAISLHNAGYDIVVLNFDNGGDYIQKNAFVLVELIKQINLNKPNTEPLVVCGFSMGGLVARYALTYMEAHEAVTGAHQTRLYVSYDSPHKGAHIPAGMQALALTFNYDVYKIMFPTLVESMNKFFSPAAKQMLKYRLTGPGQTDGEIPISSDYTSFMNELKGLNNCNGFPTKCRNIALTLGSWNGIAQRSNLDLNNDGIKDLQHSSFPIVYINVPKGTGDTKKLIWQLNTCEAIAALTFEIVLSTAYSNNYPYYSERSSYANLGNDAYSTYLYYNAGGPLANFLPSGAWQTLWWYKNYEPLDFAPGSYANTYGSIITALNSVISCSYDYADNSTFVSTVSALSYDTDDLFYNISSDPNKLDKTPFDAIYGIDGDNTSHETNQTSNINLVNSLIDEVEHDYGSTCAKGSQTLTGTVNAGQSITLSGVSNIEASNYTINSGASVSLQAGEKIVFLPGFHADNGSTLSAYIVKCSSKSCAWQPTTSMLKSAEINEGFTGMNLINDLPKINSSIQSVTKDGFYLYVFPNPNNGKFGISTNIKSGDLYITNTMGATIYQIKIASGISTININLQSGLYNVKVISDLNKVLTEKIIIK